MNINQMIAVKNIVMTGSIQSAAKNLYISKQALSKALMQLEHELGYRIFFRDNKGSKLTERGIILLNYIEPFIDRYEKMCEEININEKSSINIDKFIFFLTTVDHQSITKAAQVSDISQQRGSSIIKDLENTLRGSLFIRKKGKLILTKKGQRLYAVAALFVNAYESTLAKITALSVTASKEFYLGVCGSFKHAMGTENFSSLYHELSQTFLNLKFIIVEDADLSLEKMLRNTDIDLAFTIYNPWIHESFFHPIKKNLLVLWVSKDHPLAKYETVRLLDLKNEIFVTVSRRMYLNQVTIKACQQHGFMPNIVMFCSERSEIITFLRENRGVFIGMDTFAESEDDIKKINLFGFSLYLEMGLLYNKRINFCSEKAAVIDYLKENFEV